MSASVFLPELPAWLPWAWDALYVAGALVVVASLAVGYCVLAQMLTTQGENAATTKRAHLVR
ncbi:MAG: hypothetical protein ABI823_18515 [Bryobacteraceae bacterium]